MKDWTCQKLQWSVMKLTDHKALNPTKVTIENVLPCDKTSNHDAYKISGNEVLNHATNM